MFKDANVSMIHWAHWLTGLKPIARLHYSHLRKRLVAACVRGSPHAWMEKYFESGPPMFAEWRRGSAVAVLKVLVAEWIHFTLFKTKSVHFGGLMNSATKTWFCDHSA